MSRRQLGLLARVLGTPALLALASLAGSPRPAERDAESNVNGDSDVAWWGETYRRSAPHAGVVSSSRYLTMRDGVRLAVELYLPADLQPGERIPAMLVQTRYVRAFALRWPLERLLPYLPGPLGTTLRTMRRFVTSGYAWVAVDVRGSGASFGHRTQEWSPEEIADGREVADWIVRQPWSDGGIGATGISYEGIAAEFLAGSGHPAIKAVAPRFALFDAYAEAGFPGGIHLSWFTERWSRLNHALDNHRFDEVAGWPARLLGVQVRPVEPGGTLLGQVVDEHATNYDLHQGARGITFRDDQADNGLDVDAMSPWRQAGALQASGIPVYSYSGWFDSAFVRGAVERFLTVRTPGSRLTLGPWQHGVDYNSSPFAAARPSTFDHDGELLRFFDQHLRGIDTGIADEPPVHYYTVGANRWRAAAAWPPPAQPVPLYLAAGDRLYCAVPGVEGWDDYQVDPEAGTGHRSRWDPLTDGVAVDYGDRGEADSRLRCYDSPPLTGDIEATGHPLLTLRLSSTAGDGAIFAYLEDVAPDGSVTYVSEGELRLRDRALSAEPPPYRAPVPYRSYRREDALALTPGEPACVIFDLLPISYLFRAGHRIRLALAGADRDHFELIPDDPPLLRIYRGGPEASRLVLPVAAGQLAFDDRAALDPSF